MGHWSSKRDMLGTFNLCVFFFNFHYGMSATTAFCFGLAVAYDIFGVVSARDFTVSIRKAHQI